MNENSDFNLAKAMTIESKALIAYELDQLTKFITQFDPQLTPIESSVVAAYILHSLPQLFMNNPLLMNKLSQMSTTIKRNRP